MKYDPTPSMFNKTDVAQEVGFLVMFSANLEGWLIPALAKMLRTNVEVGQIMLGQVDNLGAKLGIVIELAKLRKGRPLPDAICEHAVKVQAAIAMRNKLCHNAYTRTLGTDDILLTLHALNAERRGKAKNIRLDAKELRAHSKAIQEMIRAIGKHCGEEWGWHTGHAATRLVALPNKPAQASWRSK